MSQPKVSRIETGGSTPRLSDIEAWARATNATADDLAELEGLLAQIVTEARSWRLVNRLGLAPRQREIAELEQSAHTIRTFQPVMVPGLLQVADYARRVMAMTYTRGPDVAAALAVRMKRQEILYDERNQFEFILTEGALRWRPGPERLMRAQLDRLLSVASLPNITLQVVPFGEAPMPFLHPFVMFELEDETLVTVETYSTELQLHDAPDVERYRAVLEHMRRAAAADSPALLRAILAS